MATATKEKPAVTSKLTFVQPSTDPNTNFLLYGPPKSGKTVGAASAPGPVLYINADRSNATRFAHLKYGDSIHEIDFEGLKTMIAVATELQGESGFKTVVLDPIADAYRILLEELSNRALNPSLPNYGDSGTHLERFCRTLCDADVNVVLVAHEQAVPDESTGGVERLPFVSTKSGSPVFAAKLLAVVDVIGYTGVVEQEGADPKYVAQLINGGGRRGGDRTGALGQSRELDLTEWVSEIKKTEAKGAAK